MNGRSKIGTKKTVNVDDYKGEWAIINSRTAGNLSGYIFDTDINNVLLMPYQKMDYDDNGQPYAKIEDSGMPYKVPKDDIGPIRPSSRDSVQNNCIYTNRKLQNEVMQDEKQRRDLSDYFEALNAQQKEQTQLSILKRGSKDQ